MKGEEVLFLPRSWLQDGLVSDKNYDADRWSRYANLIRGNKNGLVQDLVFVRRCECNYNHLPQEARGRSAAPVATWQPIYYRQPAPAVSTTRTWTRCHAVQTDRLCDVGSEITRLLPCCLWGGGENLWPLALEKEECNPTWTLLYICVFNQLATAHSIKDGVLICKVVG